MIPTTSALAEALVTNEGARRETALLAAGLILDAIELDAAGNLVVPLGDLVKRHRANFAGMYATTPAAPATTPALPRGFRPHQRPEDRAAAAIEAASKENPWLAASHNVTAQALLEARAPDLAARLKREAGQ